MSYTVDQLLAATLRGAHAVWQRNIHEPTAPGQVSPGVTELWDIPFWRRWLRDPDGGGCPAGYTRPPDPNYCLVYHAYVAHHLGDWLVPGKCVDVDMHPKLITYVMTACDRLDNPAKWHEAGFEQPEPLGPAGIVPGRLVTVHAKPGAPEGTHGVIAASKPDSAGEFHTYEANSSGMRADGSHGKGVVIKARNVRDVARVWPLGPEHYRGAA